MFPVVFVISFSLDFLSFTQFLLLTLFAVPCFFSSCFFILVFTHTHTHTHTHTYIYIYIFYIYIRIWAFVGQIMLTRSKGSWAQFSLIYRSHSAKELYSAADLYSAVDLHFVADHFPLHFSLWTFLALWSSWWAFGPCFSLGFPSYRLSFV